MNRSDAIKYILEIIDPQIDEEHTKSIQTRLEGLEDSCLVHLYGKSAIVEELLVSEAALKDNALIEASDKQRPAREFSELSMAWARKDARFFALTRVVLQSQKLFKEWSEEKEADVPTGVQAVPVNAVPQHEMKP